MKLEGQNRPATRLDRSGKSQFKLGLASNDIPAVRLTWPASDRSKAIHSKIFGRHPKNYSVCGDAPNYAAGEFHFRDEGTIFVLSCGDIADARLTVVVGFSRRPKSF